MKLCKTEDLEQVPAGTCTPRQALLLRKDPGRPLTSRCHQREPQATVLSVEVLSVHLASVSLIRAQF